MCDKVFTVYDTDDIDHIEQIQTISVFVNHTSTPIHTHMHGLSLSLPLSPPYANQ